MDYFSLLKDKRLTEQLIERSGHPLKHTLDVLLREIWIQVQQQDDFEDELLSRAIRIIVRDIEVFECDVVRFINSFMNAIEQVNGQWNKAITVKILNDSFVPPLHCYLLIAIRCIDLLMQEKDVSNVEVQGSVFDLVKKFGELSVLTKFNANLFQGENLYDKNLAGVAKSKTKRTEEKPLTQLAKKVAQATWQKYPTVSSNFVSGIIFDDLKDRMNESIKSGSTWFVDACLYDEVDIETEEHNGMQAEVSRKDYRYEGIVSPSNPYKMLRPIKLVTRDGIRQQITPLKQSKKSFRLSDEMKSEIQYFIENEIDKIGSKVK